MTYIASKIVNREPKVCIHTKEIINDRRQIGGVSKKMSPDKCHGKLLEAKVSLEFITPSQSDQTDLTIS